MFLTDPYTIFAQAKAYWEAARYPAQVSYGTTVTVTRSGVASVAHYHCYYDAVKNEVKVNGVSDEELAHPYTPHGINTFFNVFGGTIPLSAPQRTFDYLGVPILAPNYSFGIADYVPHASTLNTHDLVREIRREFNDPPKPQATPASGSGLKTIANVEVAQRRYLITLAGITPVDGHNDYDLRLKPLGNPARYRLREVWVDAQSFATDKLASQGNFTADATASIPWTVTFRQIGGAPYIAQEQTVQAFSLERHSYDTATVSFEEIHTAKIPFFATMWTSESNAQTGLPALTEP